MPFTECKYVPVKKLIQVSGSGANPKTFQKI